MTTGIGPYVTPDAADIDTDPSPNVLEITLTISQQTVDIGGGVMANAETINGTIPGPTLRLNVGDTVIVRVVNDLPHPSGIHWHGIELHNSADGTPVTQNGIPVGPFVQPSPLSPTGGTYLYKFKVPRPGIYWYHPHHHHSTNRVFRGTYGMIIVTDPNEAMLVGAGVLPGATDTVQLVLSDTTVCKAPGTNDTVTYDPSLPWVGGGPFPGQPGPTPADLCEISPMNEDGSPAAGPFAAGDIPNIQRMGGGRTNEGQTVLTNGMNVGGRTGTPTAPGLLNADAITYDIQSGQGLRLQLVNAATIRYFRLILTTNDGVQVPLVRVGGEGGLLDHAVVEGGVIGGFDTKYTTGEILLPAASRADVVAAIPAGTTGVLTLWTQDFARTGAGFANLPTVPVMHLNVTGPVAGPAYVISDGTPLLSTIPGASPIPLGAPDAVLLDPSGFAPPKPGLSDQDIVLTNVGGMLGINGIPGDHEDPEPYTSRPHFASARYAKLGDTLELTVTNNTGAHHPFHLHGFSIQPISYTRPGFPTLAWPYTEFRDNVDVPCNYTLTFRVRMDDRELADGITLGGGLGRWLFHCHIFFHAHQGMISELVTTDADGTGSEKPNVDVGGSWAFAPLGGIATRKGKHSHPDGDPIALSASIGTVTDTGGGNWSWELDTSIGPVPASTQYVYITGTDPSGRQDQAVFRLKIGAPDDGSDNGDPHIHTVEGIRYDFQAVGEFILLRDREDGIEIQARQTPVLSANPIIDPYSGLRACVSVNTAIAARVGLHRIAYQPGQERGQLQFYIDGKPARLTREGIDLDGNHVSGFDADGATALRVDYANSTVLMVTPRFWNSHNIWYMNVSISHTQADEGIMGRIPKSSWLPNLPSGQSMGPRPRSLHDRYVALYQTFANAWRVNDANSLFVYTPGMSTETFTDRDWPAEEPPCQLKSGFEIPGAPVPVGVDIEQAEQICQAVTEGDLHQDCVFDVATLGDEEFAKGYLFAQELRLRSTSVQVAVGKTCTGHADSPGITATVLPMKSHGPTPTGSITFMADGNAVGSPLRLDERGRACLPFNTLSPGTYKFQAIYQSDGDPHRYHSSASPILTHTVEKGMDDHGKRRFKLWWVIGIILLLLLLVVAVISR
ncbi:conserved hypothetical protein [Nitrosomonas nitrosa]|uniref:Multicopper oxidase with three cupredoxin domains (Includes cell division protein FtsP and spore coat protein CotA) n=1 Tax=Nitrosomonas nitrosa TaxID=52442 RepID=A0A8H9D9I3_9PROT|nr:multicopper oxidase domain-containing protein [Nitrosomonas nitrosa]CAE6509523.1 conserved hypothetical protein [Nitrosomonas nitrosa]